MQATQPRRGGFALIVVIVGVLILSGVTLTALRMAGDEASAARATRISASALYAADAGIRATQISWPIGATTLAAGDSLVDADWTPTGNGSSYRRSIYRRDAGIGTKIYSLTAEGKTYGPLGGEATVQIWLTSSSSRFPGGINSRTSASLSSQTFADSYDSRLGVYGGANVDSTTSVYANGEVTIAGGAVVYGDAFAGSTVTENGPVEITGTTMEGAPPISYPQETCPTGGYSNLPSLSGATYNQPQGRLTVQDSVVLPGRTYFFSEVRLNSGAQLIIAAGQKATIYISESLHMSAGSGLNNLGKIPADLAVISCGPGTDPWSVTAHSDPYFTIYAPNNRVSFASASPMYGAIVAGEFRATGQATIHYDTALGENNTNTGLVSRSWFQMLR